MLLQSRNEGAPKLHEGGDSYLTLPVCQFTKEQVTPSRDTRLRWMQTVLRCTHYIAGAIAYQGLCLLGEVGIHQLTFGTLSECQGSARFWFDQLDGYRPLRVEVQPLTVFAF